ncbi:hypothetical protein [Streptomyces sp. NPDC017086]|uniref:hypothetical protein n=1 Tax=Streptomyces sp. NPDC017086 TaxID=3364976 RepID=UPI0037907C50
MITLARVVCTLSCVPTQWDAWDTDGRYYYLRYRFGRGTVDTYDDPDSDTWTVIPDGHTAEFHDEDDPWCGEIELDEFLERAGMRLAPGAAVVPHEEYLRLARQTDADTKTLRRQLGRDAPTA